MNQLLHDLYQKKIQSVIIEGGAKTLSAFMENNLWDEARIFTSKTLFHRGIPAPVLQGSLEQHEVIDGDQLHIYKPR